MDLTISGFDYPLMELDIASLEQTNWSDLDDVPEVAPTNPVTKLGDMFDFGSPQVLLCGESTKSRNVAARAVLHHLLGRLLGA